MPGVNAANLCVVKVKHISVDKTYTYIRFVGFFFMKI